MIVEIKIEPAPGSRYKGELYIDGNLIETVLDKRPGCCTRSLMNRLMFMYGKPETEITVTIEGW